MFNLALHIFTRCGLETFHETFFIIHEMDTHEELVLDKHPKVVDHIRRIPSADDPKITMSHFGSLVRFEKILFHLYLIERLESRNHKFCAFRPFKEQFINNTPHLFFKLDVKCLCKRITPLNNDWWQFLIATVPHI